MQDEQPASASPDLMNQALFNKNFAHQDDHDSSSDLQVFGAKMADAANFAVYSSPVTELRGKAVF
jgi:hypothetical protein